MRNYHCRWRASLLMIGCIIAISCKKSVTPSAVISKDIVLPGNGESIIAANNKFAFDFLEAALQNDHDLNNKLISPLSIHLALSMVYNGADNSTKNAIQHALRLDNISIDDLNKTYQALIEQIPEADSKINISVANSIWYRQTIQPLPSFLNVTNNYYHASINPLDFGNANAVTIINKWASDNTQQKIPKILDNIEPTDVMFLLNAIYFKGAWQYQFDKSATANNTFYLANNQQISTPFMALKNAALNYLQNDSLKMVQLPYGAGNFNMFILLPINNITIADLASALKASSLENLQAHLQKVNLELYLPKFKYGYSIDNMKPALTGMGMAVAFSDEADFSKMYSAPVQISKAIHKTYIDVNEEGTEAAAVTAIGIGITSTAEPPPLNINHPFVYIIQEKTSGIILFTGVVNNPSLQ